MLKLKGGDMYLKGILSAIGLAGGLLIAPNLHSDLGNKFFIKVKADTREERNRLANLGYAFEMVTREYVTIIGDTAELEALSREANIQDVIAAQTLDFPAEDAAFHNYPELTAKLQELVSRFPQHASLKSLGKSLEGRDIWLLRIGLQNAALDSKPAVTFLGGHHAREHLSVDTPLRLAERILTEYQQGNQRVRQLVDTRDIHFIPAVNPDGLEFDISTGNYKMWRKNRRQNANGTYGVDLNRNYGHKWGGDGSSGNPSSDIYRGTAPFSEPETQAIKNYFETYKNVTINLSFHTYSKLILYPWGHTNTPITDDRDRKVHIKMAKKMAEWNDYEPMVSSELYTTTGDTTDWAYGAMGLISFTFELDPGQWGGGGFYPGAGIINSVVNKNYEPMMYLIEKANDPYQVLDQ